MVVRQYNEELKYLEKINPHCWLIKKGFQPNMNVEGVFYVNNTLEKLMLDELRNSCRPGMTGGFLPGVKQIANVAALPGIVGKSVGLPDIHSGYGFAIGESTYNYSFHNTYLFLKCLWSGCSYSNWYFKDIEFYSCHCQLPPKAFFLMLISNIVFAPYFGDFKIFKLQYNSETFTTC